MLPTNILHFEISPGNTYIKTVSTDEHSMGYYNRVSLLSYALKTIRRELRGQKRWAFCKGIVPVYGCRDTLGLLFMQIGGSKKTNETIYLKKKKKYCSYVFFLLSWSLQYTVV